MASTGIRELKNNLSQYVRRAEEGERIEVTAHGRVVAELAPPSTAPSAAHLSRYEALLASGVIRPATDPGRTPLKWPDIRLPKGTAAALISRDRDEG